MSTNASDSEFLSMSLPRSRTVIATHDAQRDDMGDLITRRPLRDRGVVALADPFLAVNHHGPQVYPPNNRGLPFGPHPHRGFETVTFILKGNVAHHDTGGHSSIIDAGGVQWMTAGSGLVHAEVSPPSFKEAGGALEILQLWVNLPARLKMTEPRYSGLQEADIPALPIAEGKGTLRLISGEFNGRRGPVQSLTDIFMSVVRLEADALERLPAPRDRNIFLYVVEGSGAVSGTPYDKWQLVEVLADADAIEIRTEVPTVVLFGHAEPIDEPVVAHGPFVMNTREEIVQAFQDYQAGKFNRSGELLAVGA